MEKNTLLNEILLSSSDKKISSLLTSLRKQGKVRKIAPRVYTTNLKDSDDEIVRRNLFEIFGGLYPGAIISHRSAFELRPTDDGHFFLTYSYTKNITLPGITLHLLEGPSPTEQDISFVNGLFISEPSRAFLENLQDTRLTGGVSKCLSRVQLKERLQRKLISAGEDELNRMRDVARAFANDYAMETEFSRLDKMIGAILSTRTDENLQSESAKALVSGEPFDSDRLQLFAELFERLSNRDFRHYARPYDTDDAYRNFAFFESYFSNYIEGTEFEVDEARQIVESGVSLPSRDEDSHDILGTYQIVSDRAEMMLVPDSPSELTEILQRRHALLLSARPSKFPGFFKEQNNRAGDSHFVDYRLVRGTLRKGFEIYSALSEPVAKAYFMLFMISEVHPFTDGNGRISRIMMNAELESAGLSRVIVPTVFRTDYLDALRRLTREKDSSVIIRAMERVRLFSSGLNCQNFDNLMRQLEAANAFKDEEEYILRF